MKMLKFQKNVPLQPTIKQQRFYRREKKEKNQDVEDLKNTKPLVIIAGSFVT